MSGSNRILKAQRGYHAVMMVVWAALVIPAFLWWKDSIIFVILVSLYANFASEFGAWHSSGAQMEQRESNGEDSHCCCCSASSCGVKKE